LVSRVQSTQINPELTPSASVGADIFVAGKLVNGAQLIKAAVGPGGVAEDAVPAIKAGSAGGDTAGKAFPGSVRQAALDENPGTFVYCRMSTDRPEVDHAIPRARGGNATLDNAQTTCGWCNASMGAGDFPVNPPPGYEGAWPRSWWNLLGP
jgi:hypothetical protein